MCISCYHRIIAILLILSAFTACRAKSQKVRADTSAIAQKSSLTSPWNWPDYPDKTYQIADHESGISEAELHLLFQQLNNQREQLKTFFGQELPATPIVVHFYKSLEDKGLRTGNTTFSHLENDAIHLVIQKTYSDHVNFHHALLLIRQMFAQASCKALETGLAMQFVPNWQRQGSEYWACRLFSPLDKPKLTDLLNNSKFDFNSPLVQHPLAGSLVNFLIAKWGKKIFLERYKSWQPNPAEIDILQQKWWTALMGKKQDFDLQIQQNRAAFPIPPVYHKGFCLAHEGYNIYNGYLSARCDSAQAKLVRLGCNAVSITPFTYLRQKDRPDALPFSRRTGSETDESIIHALVTAKNLGLSVMIKPHIWMRGGAWCGEIEMTTEADWDQFFAMYYDWIKHYALMAEMYQAEYLCLGVELCRTTGQTERWRELIRKIRLLYSGKITYAANWWQDYESVAFWDDLDAIGIDSYFPLSADDNPTDEALLSGMRQALVKIQAVHARFDKPVIFTEIGYRSTSAPWKKPHEHGRRESVNMADQERCYKATFQALSEVNWVEGIYWWKWPSYLDYGGLSDSDFTPNNKPAEDVVRKWFHKPR